MWFTDCFCMCFASSFLNALSIFNTYLGVPMFTKMTMRKRLMVTILLKIHTHALASIWTYLCASGVRLYIHTCPEMHNMQSCIICLCRICDNMHNCIICTCKIVYPVGQFFSMRTTLSMIRWVGLRNCLCVWLYPISMPDPTHTITHLITTD